MGNSAPRSQQSPTLTEEPWRRTKGWGREIRRELKELVVGLAPETRGELEVPFFNILLTGQDGSGKSSFFNSLDSVFRGRISANRAEVGQTCRVLTKEYRVYEMRLAPNAPPLPFRICDTMGLRQVPDELDVRNILKAVDGHVPDRLEFDMEREIGPDSPGYINNQSLSNKAHCVAIVIDASTVCSMGNVIMEKLKSLRRGLIYRELPTYILLTHIDELCPEVNQDVSRVYHSIAIRDLVTRITKRLLSLPENQAFPVMNYKNQIEMNDNMDILLLTALRQMLYSAQGYLEGRM